MIIGIGVDIVMMSRIKKEQARRILSDKELDVFNCFNLESRQLEFLSGRFAVKEAIIKAIGKTEYRIGLRDITVENDQNGMPIISAPNFPDLVIHVTLSHEKEYSVGMCVIENV